MNDFLWYWHHLFRFNHSNIQVLGELYTYHALVNGGKFCLIMNTQFHNVTNKWKLVNGLNCVFEIKPPVAKCYLPISRHDAVQILSFPWKSDFTWMKTLFVFMTSKYRPTRVELLTLSRKCQACIKIEKECNSVNTWAISSAIPLLTLWQSRDRVYLMSITWIKHEL